MAHRTIHEFKIPTKGNFIHSTTENPQIQVSINEKRILAQTLNMETKPSFMSIYDPLYFVRK